VVEVVPGGPLPTGLLVVIIATGQAAQAYKKKVNIKPDFFL
jgi:hypothetical protein